MNIWLPIYPLILSKLVIYINQTNQTNQTNLTTPTNQINFNYYFDDHHIWLTIL